MDYSGCLTTLVNTGLDTVTEKLKQMLLLKEMTVVQNVSKGVNE